jgi:tetratricopeptide (TPR) repeat protein
MGGRDPVCIALFHLMTTIRDAYARHDPWSAIHHGDSAVTMFDQIGHRRYYELSQVSTGMKRWFVGAYDDAEANFTAVRLPDEELGYGSSVRPFVRAWMYAEKGSFDKAREWANRLVTAGRAVGRKVDEGRGLWALAEVERRAGDTQAAEAAIQAAIAIFTAALPLDRPGALLTLAALRLDTGRAEEALALVEEVLTATESIGVCSLFCRDGAMRLLHADCLEALGKTDQAKATLLAARDWIESVAAKIEHAQYRQSWLEQVPQNREILARLSRLAGS